MPYHISNLTDKRLFCWFLMIKVQFLFLLHQEDLALKSTQVFCSRYKKSKKRTEATVYHCDRMSLQKQEFSSSLVVGNSSSHVSGSKKKILVQSTSTVDFGTWIFLFRIRKKSENISRGNYLSLKWYFAGIHPKSFIKKW